MATKLETSGALRLLQDGREIFLSDIEEFCSEARRLGLGDKARLITTRQGIVGPVIGWHFMIPVIPKPPDA